MKDYNYWKSIAKEIQNGKVYEIYGPEALVGYIDNPIDEWWKLDEKRRKGINKQLKKDLGDKLKVHLVGSKFNLRIFRMTFGKDTHPKIKKPSIDETFQSSDGAIIQGDNIILFGKNLKI